MNLSCISNQQCQQLIKGIDSGKTLNVDKKYGKLKNSSWMSSLVLGKHKAADIELVKTVSADLHQLFELGLGGKQANLETLAEHILKSKKIQKHAPQELAELERWLVGLQRQAGKEGVYQLESNRKFFYEISSIRDPRLLGVTQTFAEKNPDFVEFALKNHIYNQMARTSESTEINEQAGLPFVEFAMNKETSSPEAIRSFTRSWEQAKNYLVGKKALDTKDYALVDCHMTKWGLVNQPNYEWDMMQPLTKIAPPENPCFQVVSFHPDDKILPDTFGNQGHVGMIFVDSKGYVYSMGFFCHPDSNFNAFLKMQRSVLRSPDRYDTWVNGNWQQIVGAQTSSVIPPNWNEGLLQFTIKDDGDNDPCIEQLLHVWKECKREDINRKNAPEYAEVRVAKKALKKALRENTKITKIDKLSKTLFTKMNQAGLEIRPMTADQKFKALMHRVNVLQQKTKEANLTGNWNNGAVPYMSSEQSCAHVGRFYFGQWVETNLGGTKDANVINTRPLQEEQFLPNVKKSPFSRTKWARISIKPRLAGMLFRLFTILPFTSAKMGRGQAEFDTPMRTSLWGCIKKIFVPVMTPQMVREEAMGVQFKIKSVTRSIFGHFFNTPSGFLPIYR